MSKASLLEKRLNNIENKIKAFEAKQVGTIYHVCTLKAYLEYIIPDDQLAASGRYYNWVYKGDNYVSFTRDKSFVLDSRDDDVVLVQLVVDGDKLSERYKIGPYNDFIFGKKGIRKSKDDFKSREMEEVVKGPIKNISKYIKEVRFDIAATHDLTLEQDLVTLEENRNVLKNLVYFKFLRNKSADLGVSSGTPLEAVLTAMEPWYESERLQELLFSYNINKIRDAIKRGADVNKKHGADGYPLSYYCEDDDSLSIVKTLLKAGANPNVVLDNGMPILLYAIANWCNNIAVALIKAGANVNATDNEGNTILMKTIDFGNYDFVEVLLDYSADVNMKNNKGYTALDFARMSDNDDIISLLEDYDASYNRDSYYDEDDEDHDEDDDYDE